jgi:hypothetical protein
VLNPVELARWYKDWKEVFGYWWLPERIAPVQLV